MTPTISEETVVSAFNKAGLDLPRWRRICRAIIDSGDPALATVGNVSQYGNAVILALHALNPPDHAIADVGRAICSAVAALAFRNAVMVAPEVFCGDDKSFVGALAYPVYHPVAGVDVEVEMRTSAEGFVASLSIKGRNLHGIIAYTGVGTLPDLHGKLSGPELRRISLGFGIPLNDWSDGSPRPVRLN